MNKSEREFAEILGEDETDTMLWWLQHSENAKSAAGMILPT
jgi:hypothetical protein